MALGQLVSLPAMPGILTAYGLTTGAASAALAGLLIAGEAVAGAWPAFRPRSRATAPVWIYTGVSVLWAFLAAQAFAGGLSIDTCGCFGTHLAQPLRWFVRVEDGLLLLYACLMLRWSRGRPSGRNRLGHRVSGGRHLPEEANQS